MLKKAKVAILLVMALVFALQGMGMETAQAAEVVWTADEVTKGNLLDGLKSASNTGVVAETYYQGVHSESNVIVNKVIRSTENPMLISGRGNAAMGYDLVAFLELPVYHLADNLTFRIYYLENGQYVPTDMVETVNVEGKTEAEIDFGKITDPDLYSKDLYIFQEENGTYVPETGVNLDEMTPDYGDPVSGSDGGYVYIANLEYTMDPSMECKLLQNPGEWLGPNGEKGYISELHFGPDITLYTLENGTYVPLADSNGKLPDGETGTMKAASTIYIRDSKWTKKDQYLKLMFVSNDGTSYYCYDEHKISVVYEESGTMATTILSELSDLSWNLANSELGVGGNLADGVNFGDKPLATGNAAVHGTVTDNTVVSLYRVDATDGTLDQGDLVKLDPDETQTAALDNKGIPIADNEYIVFNVVVPSGVDKVEMGGASLGYYTSDGSFQQASAWEKGGSVDALSRVIWNIVQENNGEYVPFTGTVINGQNHGGVILAPQATVEVRATANATTLLAKVVDQRYGMEIHQLSLNSATTKLRMTNKPAVDVSGKKIWDDNNNEHGKRPESIEVTLYAETYNRNGRVQTSDVVKKIIVTEEDSWSWSFEGLPEKNENGSWIYYRLEEKAIAGYAANASANMAYNYSSYQWEPVYDLNITNSYDETRIVVEGKKIWDDANNQDGIRPESITVELQARYKKANGDNWTNWEKLSAPTYNNLYEYYGPGAQSIFAGITDTLTVDADDDWAWNFGGLKTKYWIWEGMGMGARQVETAWQYRVIETKFGDKDIEKKNELISGGAVTTAPGQVDTGYTVTYSNDGSAPDQPYNITNTHIPEKTEVSGTKVWQPTEVQNKPEVTINLYIVNDDGSLTDTGKSVKANANNNWTWEFADLDKYSAGELIEYTVKENYPPNGFWSEVKYDEATGKFIVYNIAKDVKIYAEKKWKDQNGSDTQPTGSAANGVQINVYRESDDQLMGSLQVNNWNNWKNSMELPGLTPDGAEAEYYVKECDIPNYISVAVKGEETEEGNYDRVLNWTVTNTYDTIDLTVEKVWDDADAAMRPTKVRFLLFKDNSQVYENGQPVAVEYDVENPPTEPIKFTNLVKYNYDGTEIVYSVKEQYWIVQQWGEYWDNTYPGYTSSSVVTPDGEDGDLLCTVTNAIEKVELKGIKTWSGYGTEHPTSVNLQVVYNNGTEDVVYITKTITGDARAASWDWTIADLPKYINGQQVTYTIKEEIVFGYDSTVSGDMYSGFTVENSKITQMGRIRLYKESADETENRVVDRATITARKRLGGVEFALYTEDDQLVGTYTTSDSGSEIGKINITNVPFGRYYLIEVEAPEGYELNTNKYWVTVNSTESPSDVEGDAINQDNNTDKNVVLNSKTAATGSLALKKTDATGNVLVGAVFTVYSDEACTASVGTMTEDATTAIHMLADLAAGTYYVKETAAPEGYVLPDKVYTVTVQAGKTINVADGSEFVAESATTITNTYDIDKVGELTLTATKAMSGREFQSGDSFTFTVTGSEGAPVPEKAEVTITPTSGSEAAVDFGKISYTEADVGKTYTYTITESAGNLAGVNYDTTGHTVTVVITEDETALVVTPTYADGEKVTITNTYVDAVEVTLSAEKTLNGTAYSGSDFTFQLKEGDTVKETVDAVSEGEVTFAPISYTLADMKDTVNGGYLSERTFTYTISEVAGSVTGMTYDTTVYTAEVTVSYDASAGKLSANVAYKKGDTAITGNVPVFANTSMELVDVSVTKVWNHGDSNVNTRPTTITAQLYQNDNEYGDVVTISDSYTWKDLPKADANGDDYVYTVKEVDVPTGYVCSVTATNAYSYTLTNTYVNGEVEFRFFATKKLVDENGKTVSTSDEEFTFKLEPVESNPPAPMPTDAAGNRVSELEATVVGNGTATFDTITLTREQFLADCPYGNGSYSANYRWYLTEVIPSNPNPNITYDDARYEIDVTVVADENGKLKIGEIEYWDDESQQYVLDPAVYVNVGVSGENTFEHEADINYSNTANVPYAKVKGPFTNKIVTTSVSVEKKWDDNDDAAKARPESIQVQLYADNVAVEGKTLTLNADNSWAGSFTDLEKYASADQEIVYTVEETAVDGYVSTVTGDMDDGFTITNTFVSGEVAFAFQKNLDGAPSATEFEFTLTVDANDADNEAKAGIIKNDDKGEITVGPLTYGKDDLGKTYTYTLSEADNSYYHEETEYTITVAIAEKLNADGDMQIEVTYEKNGTDVEEADLLFENASAATAELPVEKTLTTNSVADAAKTYSFTLTPTYEGATEQAQTISVAVNGTASPLTGTGKFELSFAAPGTYTYTVAETVDTKLPGYTYDDKVYTVTYEVEFADGKLQVKDGYPLITLNGTAADKLAFTNEYTQQAGSATLKATKVFTNGDLSAQSFTFELLDKDGNAVTDAEGKAITATSNTAGEVTFPALTYDRAGTYEYVIKEQIPTDAAQSGIVYDEKSVNVTVTVTLKDGKLETTVAYDGAATAPTFTNKQLETTGKVYVKKNFTDNKTAAGDYSFTITPEDNAPALTTNTLTLTFDGTNTEATGEFQLPTYTAPGTYIYTVKESTASKDANITYDSTEYTVVVTVTRNEDVLVATVASDDAEVTANAPLVFTNTVLTTSLSGTKVWENDTVADRPEKIIIRLLANGKDAGKSVELTPTETEWNFTDLPMNDADGAITYTVSEDAVDGYVSSIDGTTITNTKIADGEAVIQAKKTLSGATLQEGQFSFQLTGEGINEIKANDADGLIEFTAITYDMDDMKDANGNAVTEKTFTYTIKEVIPANKVEGYIYDETEHTVTVTVKQDGSTLNATVDYGTADEVVFTNKYSEASATLSVTKELVHSSDLPEAKTFTFVLKNKEGEELESKTLAFDAQSAAEQSVDFATITYKTADTYTYTVTETAIDDTTITSDSAEYNVSVVVAADANGDLQATTTITKDNEAVEEIRFTNTYNAKVSVAVTKEWVGGEAAGDIEVQLYIGENAVTGQELTLNAENQWAGTFTDLPKYDDKGAEITYTVKETAVDGYVSTVTGSMDEGFTITNTKIDDGEAVIQAKKSLNGATLEEGQFSFQLLDDEGKLVEKVANDANGNVTFAKLTYDKAGEYTYTIKEVIPEPKAPGYAYDETEHTVTVTVALEDGKLNANVTYDGKSDVPVFTNTYAAQGEVELAVEKEISGRDFMEGDSFTFTLAAKPEAGQTVPMPAEGGETATIGYADTEKVKTFGKISYTEADVGKTYTYTITETKGSLPGMTYDETAHEVTVTITDNGDGTLTVTPNYGEDKTAVTVTNTYANETTDIAVTKAWVETNAEQQAQRPESIQVQLYADDEATDKTLTLNAGNDWTDSFENLQKYVTGTATEIQYTVKEITEGASWTAYYMTGEPTGSMDEGFTITNTNKHVVTTEIAVTKKWVESNAAQQALRPASIEVQLYADGAAVEGKTLTLTSADGWTGKYTNLVKYKSDNATPIVYTVKEITEGASWLAYYTPGQAEGSMAEGFTITNTNNYNADGKLLLTGTKTVTGDSTVAEHTFTFGVFDQAGKEVATGTNDDAGNITFTEIAYTLDQVGSHLYTVKETATVAQAVADKYNVTLDTTEYKILVNVVNNTATGTLDVTWSISDPAEKTALAFTNDFTLRVGNIGVLKVDSKDTTKGLSGAEFTVYTDEDCTDVLGVITTGETGAGCLTDVPLGTYWVKETKAPQHYLLDDASVYEVTVVENETVMVNDTYITNEKMAKLALEKSDRLNPDKKLPGAEYTLYTDEECEEEDILVLPDGTKAIITTGEDGVGELEGVPAGTYWVKETKAPAGYEVDPEAYQVIVEEDEDPDEPVFVQVSDFPLRGALSLSKAVVASSEVTDTFLFDIELTLTTGDPIVGNYKATLNGAETDDVTFVATETGAKATVELKDGETMSIIGLRSGVSYTVTEQPNSRYDVTVNGVEASTASGAISDTAVSVVKYQNTLKETGFTIEKVWLGEDAGEIKLTLYANGAAMDPQPEVTRDGNTYSYENLVMKDENGEEIVYTVKETAMDGYSTTYENVAPYADKTDAAYNGGKIINQAMTSFAVKKEWSGLAQGDNAPDIQLTLYCNGAVYTSATPTPDKDGWYTYTDLPAYVDGELAVYTVKEQPVTGFTTTYINKGENAAVTDCAYNGSTIVNSKIPQTGDNAPLTLWMLTTLLAACGLMGVMATLRKREN